MPLTREQKLGGALAASACLTWGLAPLYFKSLDFLPALEIVMHRIVWSFALLLCLLGLRHQGLRVRGMLRSPRLLAWMLLTSVLLMGNWGLFIWAVNNAHMLDASLGYYINPLFNVLLGMLFLGERLRPLQWGALALAGGGVLIQLIGFGSLPWVALVLASTFALYGLLRKTLDIDAISALFIESLLMLPVALWYWWQQADSSATNLLDNAWTLNLWLAAAGVITTVPLLCFIGAARRLQLSTMGFFQYIGPSFMFVFGVWMFGEELSTGKLLSFGFIWLALALYSADALHHNRRSVPANTGAPSRTET